MNEPRNRSRKVTRKAGPPEPAEQQPAFKAPAQQTPNNDADNGSGNGHAGDNNRKNGNNGGGKAKGGNGGGGRGGNNRNRRRRGRGGSGGGRRNPVKSMQGADLTKRLPAPPKPAKDTLRIYALGGISEIGRNMTVFEYNGRLLIVDCGVLFPNSGEPGVDLVLPDFGPIENKLDKIEGLVVTHGHEDHIGAIPWLLKLRPDIPIYSSRFTNALIAAKTQEHRQRPKLHEVNKDSEVCLLYTSDAADDTR